VTPKDHLNDVQAALSALRRQHQITFVMGALAVLIALKDLTRADRIILEPPQRVKTMTITGNRVDSAWLEEMGGYVAHMMLDASPATIGWQHEQILKWVHPSTHGQLQQVMAVQAKRLTEANAATIFWMRQIATDPAQRRVVVLGSLETLVNGAKVPGGPREVAYLAEFESKSGRMLLKEWKDVPTDDIWLTKLLARQQADADATAEKRN
jgi:conjugal transfer pilus assembly protein TraE